MHRATVGIGLQAITPRLASALKPQRPSGMLMTDVTPGTPVDTAMLGLFFEQAPGHRVSLKLLRGDQEMTMQLTTVEQPHLMDQLTDVADAADGSIPALGIVGETTSKQVEQILGPLRRG